MTGRKGMDSAAARHSGNVYNRPSYGAVGNAVCRLWESSFYFSMGCEWLVMHISTVQSFEYV